jgi:hypothetical protein
VVNQTPAKLRLVPEYGHRPVIVPPPLRCRLSSGEDTPPEIHQDKHGDTGDCSHATLETTSLWLAVILLAARASRLHEVSRPAVATGHQMTGRNQKRDRSNLRAA